MKHTKPEREVYEFLFNHPTIIQAMVMRFMNQWRYHAARIRDNPTLDKDGDDALKVIKQTLTAESVKVSQIYAHDGIREFRLILRQFDHLLLLQHQNGNILGYFNSAADATKYSKAVFGEDIKRFQKIRRESQKIDHRGLGAPGTT